MSTLWCFGDSFTQGHGCEPGWEYYDNFKKDGDEKWAIHVSKEFGMDLMNCGSNGASNDYIIDSIMENYEKIKKNDIVIIGTTYHTRFDIPNLKKIKPVEFISSIIGPHSSAKDFEMYMNEKEYLAAVDFFYYFVNNENYKLRTVRRFSFLKRLLKSKDVKVIMWDVITHIQPYENIRKATDSKIDDYHFSFKGHKDFSEWIIRKIRNEQLI